MCAFSSIASKTGVRYLGELLMIWIISVVAPIVALDLDLLFTKGRIGEEVDEIAVTALAAHSLLCGHHGDRFLAIAGHDLRAVALSTSVLKLARASLSCHVRTGSVMSSSIARQKCSVIVKKCTFFDPARCAPSREGLVTGRGGWAGGGLDSVAGPRQGLLR